MEQREIEYFRQREYETMKEIKRDSANEKNCSMSSRVEK